MSARSFTVFQDASSPVKAHKPRPLGRAASAAAVLANSHLSENSSAPGSAPTSSTLAEKENTHPVTGLGVGVRSLQGKRRKMSESGSGGVLATKMLAVVASVSGEATATGKKPKAPAPAQARADLKRKALSDAGSEKTKLKREGSRSITSSTTFKRTRSSSKLLLETIKEEGALKDVEAEEGKESVKQVLINSKCRELTVSPLADVTGAYTQSTDAVDEKDAEESESIAPPEVNLLVALPTAFT